MVYYQNNIQNQALIDADYTVLNSYQRIAATYARLYNYKLTYRYLQEGIEYAEETGSKQSLGELYFTAGQLFLNNHVNKDIALEYLLEAQRIFKDSKKIYKRSEFLVFVYNFANLIGIQSKGGNSVMATVLVLALMTLPTITAISEVSIRSVGKEIEHGSLALGATKTQTNFKVILASAKSGIFASAVLGIGRALGEATAVSLVAGNAKSGPTLAFFETTSTLTSTMLEGLKETTGIDYDIRFSVGIVLMVVILLTNIILNYIKKKVGNVGV